MTDVKLIGMLFPAVYSLKKSNHICYFSIQLLGYLKRKIDKKAN